MYHCHISNHISNGMLLVHGRPQDSAESGTKEEVAALLTELLQKKAGWLAQHFSIHVDAGKQLHSVGSFRTWG